MEKEMLLCKQSKMATLGEMFENVTHQWKQPLSTINMSCANIKFSYNEGDSVDSELLETVDVIDESALYLIQTIDDFRDFAKDSSEKEILNIHDLFSKTLTILSFRLSKTEIDIQNNIEEFEFRTYKNYVMQVFINILNNSIDALEKSQIPKTIKATSSLQEDKILITICDNAGGIKLDNINSIFDKYTTTKNHEDSGLGLYICKQIMQKKLNGDIKAYNTDIGVCIELNIPILQDKEE